MGNYSKLIAAIIGALVSRWILKVSGLDLAALGVEAEFNGLVAMATETAVSFIAAGITAAFVWAFPANKPKAK